MLLVREANSQPKPKDETVKVFIAVAADTARDSAVKLLYELRHAGISADCDYFDRSLKAQMRYADKLGARFVLILGDEELREGAVTVRDMERSEQWKEKIDKVVASLRALITEVSDTPKGEIG